MIIHANTEYARSITKSDPCRRKYSCAIAEYLDYRLGELLCDEVTGHDGSVVGDVARFGRRILFGQSQGFMSVVTYPDTEAASDVFRAISSLYCLSLDLEQARLFDYDPEEIAALDNAVTDASAYVEYVQSCAENALLPHGEHMWKVHGKPCASR